MKGRLQLVKQLLLTKGNLSEYSKSPLTKLMVSEAAKYLQVRNPMLCKDDAKSFSGSMIKSHIHRLWETSWQNFCKYTNQSDGLLYHLNDCKLVLTKQRVPLHTIPRLLGQLCSLLTGHANLELHRYKLGLLYSPTCICLVGDKSPLHFLFEWETYSTVTEIYQPTLENWNTILDFLKNTKRIP